MYAFKIAFSCAADVGKVLMCFGNETSSLFSCLGMIPGAASSTCLKAYRDGCEELTPKCCRCRTRTWMQNQKFGCVLQIYKGAACDAACKLDNASYGQYPYDWDELGKDNYRFYGTCEDAQKEKALFAKHVWCPSEASDSV